MLVFFYAVYVTLTSEQECGSSPWLSERISTTLEWMMPSPPAFHTYVEIPTIKDTNAVGGTVNGNTSYLKTA
jgi:cytochrome c oxidase subunit 1